jgi:hypothetical protein
VGVVAVARWKFGAWRVVIEGSGFAFTADSVGSIPHLVSLHTPATPGSAAEIAPDDVVVRFDFPGEVGKHLEKARRFRATGQHTAAERELGHAALKLRSKRMPPADIAACLEITEHEVHRTSGHGGF